MLLVPEVEDLAQLVSLAEKLLLSLQEPYPDLPSGITIGASIGVACWPEHAEDADGLLDAADNAMYQAKHQGGGTIAMAGSAG